MIGNNTHKVERNRVHHPILDNPIRLYEEYWIKEKSKREIATEVGCGINTVLARMKEFGIPRRTITEALKGEKAPNWRGGKIKIKCDICGVEKEVYPSRIRSEHFFCSRKCKGQWQSKNMVGENAPNYGNHHTDDVKRRIAKANSTHLCTEKERKNRSKSKIGVKNPNYGIHLPEETKEKLSKASIRNWENSDYVKNVMKGRHAHPNKFEQRIYEILQKYFPNEWKYNGDFSQGVAIRRKIPDFVNVNGRKQLIECFGDIFHDGTLNSSWKATEFGTKAIYSQVGFDCLVLWYSKCEKKTDEQIAEEVKAFMENKNGVR